MDTNKFDLESLEKLNLYDQLTKEIFDSDTFVLCKQSSLKKILQFNEARCKETEIFHACIAWAKFACQRKGRDKNDAKNLRLELGNCFELIRFGAMRPEEFIKHTASYRDMFTRVEFEDILYKKSSKFTPNKFNHEPRLYFKGDLEYVHDKIDYKCPRENKEEHPELLDKPYCVENTESVWFSSDKWIALTEIQFIPIGLIIHNRFKPHHENFEFDIKVIEVVANGFEMGINGKVYYSGIATLGRNYTTISLPQAIYINPECTYEIRLEVINHPNPGDDFAFHLVAWHSDYECEDKFKIVFHKNPKKSKWHGLISELTVKRLE